MKFNISILGLYNYDRSIFDNLLLPDGVSKDILLPDLLSECSDFTLLYPDADFMKMLIGVWSAKELSIWTAMQESTELEYNPIENYDRYETIERTAHSESVGSSTSTSESEDSETGETIESRTSFNSGEAREAARAESSGNSESTAETTTESAGESDGKETVTSHMHGNIGVTTAQQMIQGYREISNFSVYNFIIDSFKLRFCVQVY